MIFKFKLNPSVIEKKKFLQIAGLLSFRAVKTPLFYYKNICAVEVESFAHPSLGNFKVILTLEVSKLFLFISRLITIIFFRIAHVAENQLFFALCKPHRSAHNRKNIFSFHGQT